MYGVSVADKFYDASMDALGVAPGAALFDKRVAVPLSQIAGMVLNDTGERLPERRLGELIALG